MIRKISEEVEVWEIASLASLVLVPTAMFPSSSMLKRDTPEDERMESGEVEAVALMVKVTKEVVALIPRISFSSRSAFVSNLLLRAEMSV